MVQPRVPARVLVLVLALALACEGEQPKPDTAEATSTEPAPNLIDQAMLGDLLGEAVEVAGDRVSADGLLVRLAFEPLIRQTGPVQLQLVQSQGYRLLGVAERSPLWQLGVRDGDVLATVDGQPILGREHELRTLWEKRPVSAEIGYMRGDQSRRLSLRVRPGSAWRGATPEVVAELTHVDPSTEIRSGFDPGIHCTPGTTPDVISSCEIDRNALARLRHPAGLAKQVRIVPAKRDDVEVGFKVFGIRASSVPAQLGLQNGDLIVALDGEPLYPIDASMAALARLQEPDASTFAVTIERRGAQAKLMIKIVDAPK